MLYLLLYIFYLFIYLLYAKSENHVQATHFLDTLKNRY